MAIARQVDLGTYRKQLKNLIPEMKKQAIDATYAGVIKSMPELHKRTPVDTGALVGSWFVRKNPEEPEPSVILGNDRPYAGVVLEYGARPFHAPIQPLLEWASRKLQRPIDDPMVRSLAWGTKRKFAREGIPPRNMLEKSIKEYILPNILKELDKVL